MVVHRKQERLPLSVAAGSWQTFFPANEWGFTSSFAHNVNTVQIQSWLKISDVSLRMCSTIKGQNVLMFGSLSSDNPLHIRRTRWHRNLKWKQFISVQTVSFETMWSRHLGFPRAGCDRWIPGLVPIMALWNDSPEVGFRVISPNLYKKKVGASYRDATLVPL